MLHTKLIKAAQHIRWAPSVDQEKVNLAYDLGMDAGLELYWLDALTAAPQPPTALVGRSTTVETMRDAAGLAFAQGRYDGWWRAARFDVLDQALMITQDGGAA